MYHRGFLTPERYLDVIISLYVTLYADAIGDEFILKDNAQCHRTKLVHEYLEDKVLKCVEWPAESSDLNPIEHR